MAMSEPSQTDEPRGLSGWKKTLAEVGSKIEHSIDDLKYAIKRRGGYSEPINVQCYRGYGTTKQAVVAGRVLEDEGLVAPQPDDSVWENIKRTWKMIETDEVPRARVRLSLAGQSAEVTCDDEGYYDHTFAFDRLPGGVLPLEAELLEPLGQKDGRPQNTRFSGEVFVPRAEAKVIVVSDVDDTVMHTGATSLLKATINTMLHNAHSRVAFAGVAAFYQALHHGPSQGGRITAASAASAASAAREAEGVNPFFYLTSSMWNIYDVMRVFFEVNGIPQGPILMRDLGLSPTKLIKGTHEEHKLARVRELMALYPQHRFVLIGDTGQHDAEIYRDAVAELAEKSEAERVAAVYLRDVSDDARDTAVGAIVEQIRGFGVGCVTAETSRDHAQHAAAAGLIDPGLLDAVDAEAKSDERRGVETGER